MLRNLWNSPIEQTLAEPKAETTVRPAIGRWRDARTALPIASRLQALRAPDRHLRVRAPGRAAAAPASRCALPGRSEKKARQGRASIPRPVETGRGFECDCRNLDTRPGCRRSPDISRTEAGRCPADPCWWSRRTWRPCRRWRPARPSRPCRPTPWNHSRSCTGPG